MNVFFEKQARELCDYLVKRGYKKDLVEREIHRAHRISRADTHMDKQPVNNNCIPFVVTFHHARDFAQATPCSEVLKTLPVSHRAGTDGGI